MWRLFIGYEIRCEALKARNAIASTAAGWPLDAQLPLANHMILVPCEGHNKHVDLFKLVEFALQILYYHSRLNVPCGDGESGARRCRATEEKAQP